MLELTLPVYLSISLFAEVFPLWGDSCTLQLHFDVSSREDSSQLCQALAPRVGPIPRWSHCGQWPRGLGGGQFPLGRGMFLQEEEKSRAEMIAFPFPRYVALACYLTTLRLSLGIIIMPPLYIILYIIVGFSERIKG